MERVAERRKHKRFNVQPGVLAVLGPASAKMGQIIDVCRGGLAFHYKEGNEKSAESYELSILFDDNNKLNHRPFKFNTSVVSDIEVVNEKPFSKAIIRRCSLEFDDLTYYQTAWLDDCIRNYTTGSIQPES